MVTGKSRMWQRAGGGGVSGQKQKTHGMTKQTQEANDIINKHKKHMATRVLWPAEGILTLLGSRSKLRYFKYRCGVTVNTLDQSC